MANRIIEELIKKPASGRKNKLLSENPSSPQKTWKMLISDIHGEHYYLTQDEWNAMAARFNVSGIPHYMLVDKKGKVVRDHFDVCFLRS